jgi:CheY-like chemotaxis protein
VVEPDILVRMVIADYLRDCGYKVVEGTNADDVLAVLGAGRKINIILAEVQLAGSRRSTLRRRREAGRWPWENYP